MDSTERKIRNVATGDKAIDHPTHSFYIDLNEASRRLSLSVRTLRNYIVDPIHPLPAYRLNGKILFAWGEVEQWLKQFRVQTVKVPEIISNIFSKKERKAHDGKCTKEAKAF